MKRSNMIIMLCVLSVIVIGMFAILSFRNDDQELSNEGLPIITDVDPDEQIDDHVDAEDGSKPDDNGFNDDQYDKDNAHDEQEDEVVIEPLPDDNDDLEQGGGEDIVVDKNHEYELPFIPID